MTRERITDTALPTPHGYEVSFSSAAYDSALPLYGESDIVAAINTARQSLSAGGQPDMAVLGFFHDWATVLSSDSRNGYDRVHRMDELAANIDSLLERSGTLVS